MVLDKANILWAVAIHLAFVVAEAESIAIIEPIPDAIEVSQRADAQLRHRFIEAEDDRGINQLYCSVCDEALAPLFAVDGTFRTSPECLPCAWSASLPFLFSIAGWPEDTRQNRLEYLRSRLIPLSKRRVWLRRQ